MLLTVLIAVIVVPAAIPAPAMTVPTVSVPEVTPVTLSVLPEILPVKTGLFVISPKMTPLSYSLFVVPISAEINNVGVVSFV